MKKVEELNYYELLDVEPSATSEEIHKAYLLSLATFRPDWFATYSILTEAEREKTLKRTELAFEVLRDPVKRKKYDKLLCQAPPGQLPPGLVEKSRPSAKPEVAEPPAGFWTQLKLHLWPKEKERHDDKAAAEEPARSEAASLSDGYVLSAGQYLKTVRMSRGISLEAMAQNTRINIRYLRALEEEQYDRLPSEFHARYMLAAYAKSLKIDTDSVVRSYKANRKTS